MWGLAQKPFSEAHIFFANLSILTFPKTKPPPINSSSLEKKNTPDFCPLF